MLLKIKTDRVIEIKLIAVDDNQRYVIRRETVSIPRPVIDKGLLDKGKMVIVDVDYDVEIQCTDGFTITIYPKGYVNEMRNGFRYKKKRKVRKLHVEVVT